MGLASRKGITVYMLCIHIVCILLCEREVTHGFKIFRGEQDIFTNLNCTGEICTRSQCESYGAECVSDNCTYCRCLEWKNTFIIDEDDQRKGECKSGKDIVPKSGCYRFSDGSFLKYLMNYEETNPTLRIFAPILKDNDGDCQVGHSFKFIRDGQKWETSKRNFSVSIKSIQIETKVIKELQFYTTENFKVWNGSLLQLSVACGNEEHCVLLKLASLSDVCTCPLSSPPSTMTTTRETSKNDETHGIAIVAAVTLFLLALALGIGYVVYYGKQKRVAENNGYDHEFSFNFPKRIYEDPDPLQGTIMTDETPPNRPEIFCKEYSQPSASTGNGILKRKGHDMVADEELGTSNIHPEMNENTKPAEAKEEEHKLPNKQAEKPSETKTHSDSNIIANSTLTKHDNQTEEECKVPSNAEPEISSAIMVYSNTNTTPAVTEKVPLEDHELTSKQPEIPSDTNNIQYPLAEQDKQKEIECELPSNTEAEISSDISEISDTNTTSAVTENAPLENHKLPSKQLEIPSHTNNTHSDSKTMTNSALTEHDKQTKEVCEVPVCNVEARISTSDIYAIPQNNSNTSIKPGVN